MKRSSQEVFVYGKRLVSFDYEDKTLSVTFSSGKVESAENLGKQIVYFGKNGRVLGVTIKGVKKL